MEVPQFNNVPSSPNPPPFYFPHAFPYDVNLNLDFIIYHGHEKVDVIVSFHFFNLLK